VMKKGKCAGVAVTTELTQVNFIAKMRKNTDVVIEE
jgi:hypothetical protein